MSMGIGMEAGQKEADYAAQTAAQIAEALIQLLRTLGRRRTERYSDHIDRGLRVIERHVKQGGILKQSIMEERDAEIFASALRDQQIPYMQVSVRDDDGKMKRIFYTRGGREGSKQHALPDDSALLEKAWASFIQQMMQRMRGNHNDHNTGNRIHEGRRNHGRSVDIV